MRSTILAGVLLNVLLGVLAGTPAQAQQSGGACAALSDLKVMNTPRASATYILSASEVRAAEGLPAYCRVRGYVLPSINFEIRLPLAGWNGRFYMAGCGGYCGDVDADRPGLANGIDFALRRSYAVAATDSGHWGTSVVDGRWAYDNRRAEIDWAERAVNETTTVGKAVVAAFYDRPAERSYFQGCSTGGRQALMAALKTPQAFDGILAGAPALDYTGLVATSFAWLVQANTAPAGGDVLTPAKVELVREAVYEACDGVDGLEDGLIADPRRCDWQPRSLRCNVEANERCLTEDEVRTLEAWYGGAQDPSGRQLYPGGLPRGSEPYWWLWLTGDGKGGGRLIPLFARDFLRYMAFQEDPGDSYEVADFDFATDPERLAFMAEIYNADDPDLSSFKAAGGRLLMFHGWADAIVTPFKTLAYHREVTAEMGGREATDAFLRLFMVPGMDHCGILPGPGIDQSGFDPLSALEDWVERGEAPDSLLATKKDAEGRTLWTRPLCPYPQQAVLTGGDPQKAESFACAEPE